MEKDNDHLEIFSFRLCIQSREKSAGATLLQYQRGLEMVCKAERFSKAKSQTLDILVASHAGNSTFQVRLLGHVGTIQSPLMLSTFYVLPILFSSYSVNTLVRTKGHLFNFLDFLFENEVLGCDGGIPKT